MKLRNKKTGELIDLDEWSFDTYNDKFYIARGDAEGDNIEYFNSLADLCSKYEDYTQKEPLIKDKNIRKAVRAWAEAIKAESAFVEKPSFERADLILSDNFATISFSIDKPKELNFCERYTIEELCGEKEE